MAVWRKSDRKTLLQLAYTSTGLNNFQGTRTVEQAAREPVRLALLGPDGPTGTFSNEDGPLPW